MESLDKEDKDIVVIPEDLREEDIEDWFFNKQKPLLIDTRVIKKDENKCS